MRNRILILCCGGVLAVLLSPGVWAEKAKEDQPAATQPASTQPGDLVELTLKLPKPAFVGTPKNPPPGLRLEDPKVSDARRPPLVPRDAVNLAARMPVTSSDADPIIGSLALVTDGDKETTDGSYVELAPGLQWVQIDLKKAQAIHAVVIWHFHGDPRVYRDVVVQLADDEDFITNVRTVYNSDHDNSAGLGIGKDYEYFETNKGRAIAVPGLQARYLRCYSKGSTSDGQNHYCEVEVFGVPAP